MFRFSEVLHEGNGLRKVVRLLNIISYSGTTKQNFTIIILFKTFLHIYRNFFRVIPPSQQKKVKTMIRPMMKLLISLVSDYNITIVNKKKEFPKLCLFCFFIRIPKPPKKLKSCEYNVQPRSICWESNGS